MIAEGAIALGADAESVAMGRTVGDVGFTTMEVVATGGSVVVAKKAGKELAEQGLKSADDMAGAAADTAHRMAPDNPSAYSVFSEQTVTGTTRQTHRAQANRALFNQLDQNPGMRQSFDQAFGTDVMAHMRSGKSGLLNPPGTAWHHPIGGPGRVQLTPVWQHNGRAFQPLMHPNRLGGYATHYGP